MGDLRARAYGMGIQMSAMLCVALAIGGVCVVGVAALITGHNGSVLTTVVGALTGLAGFVIGKYQGGATNAKKTDQDNN